MSERIEAGDVVDVYWDDDEGTHMEGATVLHVPCDVGDMWHLRDIKGDILYVNPSCHTLNSIVKRAKALKEV